MVFPLSCLILEGPSPRTEYLEAYNRVDMVLDTFPYPGGTTSFDAIWMGVPVLTLKGERFLSHMGESIAHNAGQAEWIAADRHDYSGQGCRVCVGSSGSCGYAGTSRETSCCELRFSTWNYLLEIMEKHYGACLNSVGYPGFKEMYELLTGPVDGRE